jgi:hypothetical protein
VGLKIRHHPNAGALFVSGAVGLPGDIAFLIGRAADCREAAENARDAHDRELWSEMADGLLYIAILTLRKET